MSNCDFVAGRSLIALAASRLALRAPALRAPALRAATTLTRPKQSAQRLAYRDGGDVIELSLSGYLPLQAC
jgi:hypothetical protein